MVSEFWQRNTVRRASGAEDLAAVPAVVAPLHHREVDAATHALGGLHVRDPDGGPLHGVGLAFAVHVQVGQVFAQGRVPVEVRRYAAVFLLVVPGVVGVIVFGVVLGI